MKKSTNANGDGGRGNARDRAARRRYLLTAQAGWGGNGETVPCAAALGSRCEGLVGYDTMNVDRIVPGCLGGRYVRTNIRPTCFTCNNDLSHEQKAELKGIRQLAMAA
jgi:hypothetical protein